MSKRQRKKFEKRRRRENGIARDANMRKGGNTRRQRSKFWIQH